MRHFLRDVFAFLLSLQMVLVSSAGPVLVFADEIEVLPVIEAEVIPEEPELEEEEELAEAVPVEEELAEEDATPEEAQEPLGLEDEGEDEEEVDVEDESESNQEDEHERAQDQDQEDGDGEEDSDENVQNEQNVDNNNDEVSTDVVQPVQIPLETYLEQVQAALKSGELSRKNPAAIEAFVRGLGLENPEQLEKLMQRYPAVQHRELPTSTLETESAVIPAGLLKNSARSTVAPGIRTNSIQAPAQAVEFVSDRVLIQVNSQSVAEQWIAQAEIEGLEIRVLQEGSQPLLRIDSTQDQSTIALLQKYVNDPNVVYQEPDYVYVADAVPNDPFHSLAWHHNNQGISYNGFTGNAGEDIQSEDAWDITTGDGSVIVAVIDTGVMLNHPDLQNNLWDGTGACVDENGTTIAGGCPHSGYDYFDFDDNPSDESNHGTLVAGSVAAQGNNSAGVAGVNWDGTIMALKAGTANSNKLSGSAIVNSINFAVRNGAEILNMSFSSSGESTSITNAISFARTNGVLVIASAGNSSLDLDVGGQNAFPCETNLDNIICIAATNVSGTLEFLGAGGATSNYGLTSVDIAAPGTHVLTTLPVQTDLYTNNFQNGASDVADFTLSGGSGWGLKSGANNVLTTHTGGSYGNNESTFAELDQTFDLSSYESGTLIFEMNCVTDNSVDGSGFPLDGVGVEFSQNGGTSFTEILSFNGALTASRGLFDTGANGQPLITVGLIDSDFVSQFRFRFHFFSDGSLTGTGCDIDEVTLRVTSGSNFSYASGTSFAAPVVAGLASLIWEYDSGLTYTQVRDQLFAGGETLPALTTTTITGKRINAYRSLALMTDPAVVNLRGFLSNGGTEFSDADSVSTTDPFFSWTAPTGQGIISGYSFAVDGVPDAVVDTVATETTLSGLSQGAHTFQVFGVNDVGVTGTVAVFNFTVDTIAPDAPTGVAMNTNDVVNAGNVASSSLTGTAAEAATLNFAVSDSVNPDVTGNQAVGSGAFTINSIDLSSLNEGSLSLSATLTDAAGNTSGAGVATLNKDSLVSTPTSLQLNGGTPINAATAASVNLSFDTTESGSASYAISDGVNPDVTGNVTVTGAGTTTTSVNHSSLNDTTLNISVIFTDDAGNVATTAATTLLKDTQVSDASSLQLNGGSSVNASNAGSTSLTFDTLEAGNASYSISDGTNPDVTGATAVAGAGTTTVNSLNLSGLDDGPLTVSVTFTDTVGNAASAAVLAAAKDVVVAAVTNVQLNGNAIILAATQTSVDLTFDGVEAGSVTYSISDGVNPDVTGAAAVSGAGTTTVAGLDVSSLDDGTLNFSVIFTDTAGNVASAGAGNVQKDGQVPLAPTGVQLNGSTTINAATETSVDITGTVAEAGNLLYSIIDGVNPAVAGAQAVAAAGAFTIAGLDVSSLDDGTLTVFVTITDAAGNTSTDGNNTVGKDTQVSTAGSVQLNGGTIIVAANQTSVDLTFTTTEAGSASFIISDGVNPDITGSPAVSGAGTTTVAGLDVSGLDDGTLNLSVTFTDSAGNTAAAGTGNVQKDSTVNSAANVELNGGTPINNTTQTSVDLTFDTAEAGSATYSISDGVNPDITGATAVAGAGTTTVAGLDVSGLNDGTLNLSVTFTDAASNPTPAALGTVQKDVLVSAATSVALNGGTTISAATQASVDLTFDTTEAGTASFTISDGVNPDVTGSPAVSGAGTTTVAGLDVSSLDDGTLNLSVIFTDSAGNVASAGLGTVQKDVLVSAVTSVQLNGSTTINNATQTSVDLTFDTSEAGSATYSISDGVNPDITGATAVAGAGTTTVSGLDVSSLDDGTLYLSVIFTDAGSNLAPAGVGTVGKDVVAPAAPTGVQMNAGVAITATTQTAVTVSGTLAEGGSLLFSIIDGVNPAVTGGQALGSGAFNLTGIDVSSLNDGTLTVFVTVTDAAGNTSTDGNDTESKDAQVSAATGVQLNGGTAINAASQNSVDLGFTTTEAGSASYSISDGVNPDVAGLTAVAGAGTTTVSALDVSSLNDGTLNLSVVFSDSVGNTALAGTGNVQKDVVVAAATNVQLNGGAAVNSSNQNNIDLTFDTLEAGSAAYTISDGVNPDVTGASTVAGAGTTTVAGLDVSSLNDGTLNVSVTFTDSAANAAGAAAGNVQKDVVVAAASSVQLNAGTTIIAATQTSVDLTFDAAEAGTATFSISDGVNPDVTGSPAVAGAGTTTVAGLDVSSLNDGTLNLSVIFTDTAGNSAAAGVGTVDKDATANAPTALLINSGQAIILATQTVSRFMVTVDELGTLDYTYTDGSADTVVGSHTVTSIGVQTVSNINLSALDEGTLNFSVTFTDPLGNVSSATVGTATKDTIVSSAASVLLNAGSPIDSASATSINLSFQVLEPGTASFIITDQNSNTVTGTVSVSSGTITVSGIDVSVLADGPLVPAITFVDSAGNTATTVTGAAVQKTTGVVVSGGSGRRRRNSYLVTNEDTGEQEEQDGVVVVPDAPAEDHSGGGGSGKVLGSNTEEERADEPVLEPAGSVLPFDDLNKEDEAYEAVLFLYLREIVQGQGDSGSFDQEGVLDRAQALKMLLMLAGVEVPESVSIAPFLDVELTAWFAPIISIAKDLGFVEGYADGSFIPWRTLNRAEALVLAYRILGIEPEYRGSSLFVDVADDVWFAAAIHDAVDRGLLKLEVQDGLLFAEPTADMTRAEFAILIVGLFEAVGP